MVFGCDEKLRSLLVEAGVLTFGSSPRPPANGDPKRLLDAAAAAAAAVGSRPQYAVTRDLLLVQAGWKS